MPAAPWGSPGQKLLLTPAHPLPWETRVQEPGVRMQKHLHHFSCRGSTMG